MLEKINEVIAKVKKTALSFGGVENVDYIFRENVEQNGSNDTKGKYFGFISPEEPRSGVYHDFSLVVLPSYEIDEKWLVSLVVGSQGFRNDLALASRPGTRRKFQKIVSGNGFIKSDFTNISSTLSGFKKNKDLEHLKDTIKMYSTVLQANEIVDPFTEEGLNKINAFLATYAQMREWRSNHNHDKAIAAALLPYRTVEKDDLSEIEILLHQRKYVVIQGAPGTGKTYTAKQIAKKGGFQVFFTQFHSETTYSDFIYGIRPGLESSEVRYSAHNGEFVHAIKYALKYPHSKVLLIIDEINRANLSSVLGPIFYLFEYQDDNRVFDLELVPGMKITEIPENLFVIATMNTADRSLAVVDFALRRRFAWYTLKPKVLKTSNFHDQEYLAIASIFEEYANHQELNLQPGPAYFIADKEEFVNRIKYELYPLIQEYLDEGLLIEAKDEFNSFFIEKIGKPLYE